MTLPPENSLAQASSPYLRSASTQPVHWQPWGPEAFAQAREQGKPILLDIGATWAHWSRVMAAESYSNEGTAALINELFVPIKVDRDERPDIDARYQSAVAAISGQGGWPLTAFLTPDGRPFFGGGYFPPQDRYGRPSLERVCVMMHEAFTQRRDEVLETAESVMAAVEGNERFADAREPLTPGSMATLLGRLTAAAVTQFDARNGGFGQQPKFPNSPALDLLLGAAASATTPSASPSPAEVVRTTLTKMAQGGIHDHLAGGFHRYSTDEQWRLPRFEKLAYDNAALLGNYARAYALFRDPLFRSTACGILRFFTDVLSDQAHGGFYSSQAADHSLGDEGDFFTWTRAEAQAVLTPEELTAVERHFNLRPVGDMRHNPAKNVLHMLPSATADTQLLEAAKGKLLAARLERPAPPVDRTLYTGWNALCISAFLTAADALKPETSHDAQSFALKTLDRLLRTAWSESHGLLKHVLAYPSDITVAPGPDPRTRVDSKPPSPATPPIPGTLDDYAFTAAAALDAYTATDTPGYLAAARSILDAALSRFYDPTGGAFFDTEPDPAALGALTARRKPLQDSPTPSGNAAAATALLRLAALVPDGERYRTAALRTLETFAGVVEHFGLYAASYGLALQTALTPPVKMLSRGNGTFPSPKPL